MTDKNKVWRQGDVVIRPIDSVPDNLVVREELVLAYGEVTGHAHRVTSGEVKLYVKSLTDTANIIMRVLSEHAKISHEEHEDIVLPMGDYNVNIQYEYEWASKIAKRVED